VLFVTGTPLFTQFLDGLAQVRSKFTLFPQDLAPLLGRRLLRFDDLAQGLGCLAQFFALLAQFFRHAADQFTVFAIHFPPCAAILGGAPRERGADPPCLLARAGILGGDAIPICPLLIVPLAR